MNSGICHIRDASIEDAERLSILAGQLGYPSEAAEVAHRLAKYAGNQNERVIVAVNDGEVVGWTSAGVVDHFYTPVVVEISGLVVDSACRGSGTGKLLVDKVKRWALSKGLGSVRLRANVMRKDAHRFYEREGFERRKEQIMFEWTSG